MTKLQVNSSTVSHFREIITSIPSDYNSLLVDILLEINDEQYLDLRHGERHTRNKGCKGPLCKKALRDQRLEYTRRVNQQHGRTTRRHARSALYVAIDPILERVKLAYDKAYDGATKSPAELQTAGAA